MEAAVCSLAPSVSRSASAAVTGAVTSCSALAGLGVVEDVSSAGNTHERECAMPDTSTPDRSRAKEGAVAAAAVGGQHVHDLEAPARPGFAFASSTALFAVGRILACSSHHHSSSGGASGISEYVHSPAASSATTKATTTAGGVPFLAEACPAGLSGTGELLKSPAPTVFEKTVRGGGPRRLMPAAAALARSLSTNCGQVLDAERCIKSPPADTAPAHPGRSESTATAAERLLRAPRPQPAPTAWGSASFDATVSVAAAAAAAMAAAGSAGPQHMQGAKAISALLTGPSEAAAHSSACACAAAAPHAGADTAVGGDGGRCQSCPMAWPLHLLEAGAVLTALVSPADSGANALVSCSGGTDGALMTAPCAALHAAAAPVVGFGSGPNAASSTLNEQQQQHVKPAPQPPQLLLQPVGARRCRMSMEEALPEHPLLRLMSGAGSGVVELGSSGSGAMPATPTATAAAGEACSGSSSKQPLHVQPHPIFGSAAGGGGTMTASEGLSWMLISAEAAELATAPASAAAAAGCGSSGGSTATGSKPSSSGGMVHRVVDVQEAARVVAALQPVMQELEAMRAEMGLLGGGGGAAAAAGISALRPTGVSVSSGPWLASASSATGSAAGLVQAPVRDAVSAAALSGSRGRGPGVGAAASTASDAATVLSAVFSSLPDLEECGEPMSPGTSAHASNLSAPLPVAAMMGFQRHAVTNPHSHGHQRHGGTAGAGGRGAQLQPRARLLAAGLAVSQLESPASPSHQGARGATAATSASASSSTTSPVATAAAHSSSGSSGGKASRKHRR